jgi:hypothetical protein
MLDKDLFGEIRQQEVVLNNQDLEHALSSSRHPIETRAAEIWSSLLRAHVAVDQGRPDQNC